MDRVFLDANVLFSAAYRERNGLLRLWKLSNVVLCSSRYALEEARINLQEDVQRARLLDLAAPLEWFEATGTTSSPNLALPEKDIPILLAARRARATHLITGDLRHFGRYLNKKIEGILVQPPGEYLRNHARHSQNS